MHLEAYRDALILCETRDLAPRFAELGLTLG
jgi:hypothetical protein